MNKTITMGAASRRGRLSVVGLVLMTVLGLLPVTTGGLSWTATALAVDHASLVDLNSASLEEVLSLPIPEDVARSIVNYRTYLRYFDNVYELREVDGMTPEIMALLKPLVSTIPRQDADPSLARLSASYRQVRNYLGQEGSSEGLVDEYLDRLRNPENLNEMDLWDLMSYQNVSPVDATNIIKARERLGHIETGRQLRGSEGLRYFAYRSLRDFVVYSEEEKAAESSRAVSGYAQTRYWETPLANADTDDFSSGVPNPLFPPGWMNKIRVNIKGGYQAGAMTVQEYGEQNWDETVKAYAGVADRRFGNFRLKSAVVGNYRVAYGLGLVMDNTDYIHFRKTGFGWNKRLLGVHGDLSRSYEYTLTGGAFEGNYGPLNASFFVSSEMKDGVLNADGTINRYITMRPRVPSDILDERSSSGLRRDAFQEDLIGGNVKLMLAPGTFIGMTGYEARYNRGFNSDVGRLIENTDLLEARDSEISEAYTSVYIDENGEEQEARFRRVFGAEAQAVWRNVSIQGEAAFMQRPQNEIFKSDKIKFTENPFTDVIDAFSDNPHAYIVNAFTQWNNLHLLAIYRDYDVAYDNPYSRAFSNDSKYEMTLLSSSFRLNDPLYWWLEAEGAQPKGEKGLFLETRYRISRKLILSGLQFDQWERKADGADMLRYTIKGEYQPIFNLRFRVRHRYSSRSEADPYDVRKFQSWETRWQLIGLLSNYSRIQLMYMNSNVMFPPRARLGGTAEAGVGDPAVAMNGNPGNAFEVKYEHNLTPGIKIHLASSMYNGFFWNFEGSEFVLLDGNGFRNWFKIESRVSDRMLFQLKVTRDHNMPTSLDVRRFGDPSGNDPDAPHVPRDQTTIRLQMDYTF